MSKINELGLRIKQIREFLELNQSDFSKSLNLSLFALKDIERGKTRETQKTLRDISEQYSINYYWLNTGENIKDTVIPSVD